MCVCLRDNEDKKNKKKMHGWTYRNLGLLDQSISTFEAIQSLIYQNVKSLYHDAHLQRA